jgi:hypothetical protein
MEVGMNFVSTEKRRYTVGFAAAGTAMTILFLAIVNYVTSPYYPWFIYPAFAVLWWPLSVIVALKYQRTYAFAGSLLILIFLLTINLVFSPFHFWVLYAAFPILCWPVIICLGKRAGRFPAAATISLAAIVYYFLLNKYFSPGFPWFIFPTYAVLWWPLSVLFAKKTKMLQLSLAGTLITIAFFIVLNAVTTPDEIWAVFPIFGVLWWPLTIYCFVFKKQTI